MANDPDPPTPGRPSTVRTRLSADDRRAAILTSTVPLLVQHGAGVTTRQIADAAGVAEGTLFRAFDDKRALLTAALARALDPEPVVAALLAVPAGRPLAPVLHDLVEVVVTRSADMRAAMAVAHEMRRAAGDQHAADLLRAIEAMHADADRPGSFAHAVHELRSRAGLAPQRIVAALTEVLGEHRAELRREPGVCARIVFSVVSSSFHDPLGATEQLPAHEVVEVLLHGLLARPSHPEAPC